MKLYEKIIDGKQHCKPANKIVIVKDGMQTFNPTEEMLLEDGWKIHELTPYEPTEEELLNEAKERVIQRILHHDSSDEVNIFYVGGQKMWLDKATRVGLKLRFDAEMTAEKTTTTLWYDGMSFELELTAAVQMLNAIEMYASACYDNTQKHIANVKSMNVIEDIESYDYRTGYPNYLRF